MAYQIININEINDQDGNIPIGIQLPFNGQSGLFTSTFTSIDQAISNLKNLLLTNKGERVMQPAFGTDLSRILFEPNTSELKAMVDNAITEPVNYWLPYINIIVKISFQIVNSTTDDALNTITIFVNDNQLTVQ